MWIIADETNNHEDHEHERTKIWPYDLQQWEILKHYTCTWCSKLWRSMRWHLFWIIKKNNTALIFFIKQQTHYVNQQSSTIIGSEALDHLWSVIQMLVCYHGFSETSVGKLSYNSFIGNGLV